jgi:hypothetical protein
MTVLLQNTDITRMYHLFKKIHVWHVFKTARDSSGGLCLFFWWGTSTTKCEINFKNSSTF